MSCELVLILEILRQGWSSVTWSSNERLGPTFLPPSCFDFLSFSGLILVHSIDPIYSIPSSSAPLADFLTSQVQNPLPGFQLKQQVLVQLLCQVLSCRQQLAKRQVHKLTSLCSEHQHQLNMSAYFVFSPWTNQLMCSSAKWIFKKRRHEIVHLDSLQITYNPDQYGLNCSALEL